MPLNGGLSTDEMFSIDYEELRRLASRLTLGEGSPTFDPAALVHEAYLSLAEAKRFQPESLRHLKHAVVLAMRRLLVDAARCRAASSRGGGKPDELAERSAACDPEPVLALSLALDELAKHSELQARVFECYFISLEACR
jgi:hypothetical protein